MSFWKKIRHRCEWLGCLVLARLIPLLPRHTCVTLANFAGTIACRLDAAGRRVALANLEAAFGEIYSEMERRRIACASYCNFARTMLDLFWSPRLRVENHETYLTLEGGEVLQKLKDEGRGAILMCVHQDNFEWASLACGFHGFPSIIVAESFKNPLLAPIFRSLREVSGHQLIDQENSMIRLLKHVKRGGFAGMLVDLNLRPT